MREISDEIKAKIIIEADTSGAEEAAAALEKLQGATGASAEGAGGLGDQLAAMEKQASATAGEVAGLAEETGGFEEAAKSGEETVSGFNDTLNEHQQAVEDIQTAYEGLQPSVEQTTKSLGSMQETLAKSSPAVSQLADNMAALQTSLAPDALEENMGVFQDLASTPQPFLMLQGYLQETGQSMDSFAQSIGKNYSDVLGQMQQSNGAFTDTQTAMEEFNRADPWTNMAVDAKNAGESIQAVGKDTQGFASQLNAVNDAATTASEGINKFGGVGSSMYGPLTQADTLAKQWDLTGNSVEKAMSQMGMTAESSGLGGVLSSAFGDLGGVLEGASRFAMPLMALQMVGSMVMQVGQSIYDSAAIAEGPAAHSMGTFTGTVDALGQSMQQTGAIFSESFGQQLLPTLNALNYQTNQDSGGAGGLGKTLGATASYLGNLGLMLGGAVSMTVPGGQGIGWEMLKTGFEGQINQYAEAFGMQQPFQGPGPQAQTQIDYQRNFANLPQTVGQASTNLKYQGDLMMAEASDPSYFQNLQYANAAQEYYQQQQISYNSSHPPMTPRQAALQYQNERGTAADQNAYQQYLDQGGTPITPDNPYGGGWGSPSTGGWGSALLGPGRGIDFGGIFNGIGSLFSSLNPFSGNDVNGAGGFYSTSGCFVAGTRILMADGSEKPIETLQTGEHVIAHDGKRQLRVTVRDWMTYEDKQTYELTFSDSNTLTLTDAHPLYSPDAGWRSLSPEATAQEHPGLITTVLQIGDTISTTDGTCTLIAIEKQHREQVYNITVDGPHTYFANRVLVHNAKMGGGSLGGGAQEIQMPHIDMGSIASNLAGQFSGIQLPHLDLGGIASNLGGAFSGISLPHLDLGGIGSSLAGAFSGIQLPHLDLGGIASSLGGAFSGITLPPMPNIGGMIQGALGGIFSGITLPPIPDIGSMIQGALGGMFSGITLPPMPDIGGMIQGAIGGIFSSVHMPSIPDFGAMINGAIGGIFSSIHIPSIPGFAAGVEGFSGGLAMVGESGPELVTLPNGSSVYPLTSSAPLGGNTAPISLGGGGNSGAQTANIAVYLDSQMLTQMLGVNLASSIRVGLGNRSY